MRLRLIPGLLALLLGLTGPAGGARADSLPQGRWWTQDHDGVIAIEPCGAALCGRIMGEDQPFLPDGTPQRDVHGAPQCGLVILHDARLEQDGRWYGLITDPRDGQDWHCELWLENGTLRLRGYVLITLLGQTQTWTRFAGRLSADCRIL